MSEVPSLGAEEAAFDAFPHGRKPGDLHAEAALLKLGRRIATADIWLWTEGRERPAAKTMVADALP